MLGHPQATESEMGDVDLSGLPEAPVDSEDEEEDEDIERSSEALLVRDLVRECLEKDAVDRTDDDIGKAINLSVEQNCARWLFLCSQNFLRSVHVLPIKETKFGTKPACFKKGKHITMFMRE